MELVLLRYGIFPRNDGSPVIDDLIVAARPGMARFVLWSRYRPGRTDYWHVGKAAECMAWCSIVVHN